MLHVTDDLVDPLLTDLREVAEREETVREAGDHFELGRHPGLHKFGVKLNILIQTGVHVSLYYQCGREAFQQGFIRQQR